MSIWVTSLVSRSGHTVHKMIVINEFNFTTTICNSWKGNNQEITKKKRFRVNQSILTRLEKCYNLTLSRPNEINQTCLVWLISIWFVQEFFSVVSATCISQHIFFTKPLHSPHYTCEIILCHYQLGNLKVIAEWRVPESGKLATVM